MGLDNSFCGEDVGPEAKGGFLLCILGYRASILASIHYMPVALSAVLHSHYSCDKQNSPYFAIDPWRGGTESTPTEITDVTLNKWINLGNPSKYNCDIPYYNMKASKSLPLVLFL